MLDPPSQEDSSHLKFVCQVSAGSGGKGERLMSYHCSPSRSRSGLVELCQLSVVIEPLTAPCYGKVRLAFRNKSYGRAW